MGSYYITVHSVGWGTRNSYGDDDSMGAEQWECTKMSQNGTFKNGYNSKYYVMYILPQ